MISDEKYAHAQNTKMTEWLIVFENVAFFQQIVCVSVFDLNRQYYLVINFQITQKNEH